MDGRMFLEMLKPAKEWLMKRDLKDVAAKANVQFDENVLMFGLKSMGDDVCMSWPDAEVTPPLEGWYHLVLLHYLYLADGTPLDTKWISFGQMKDGLIRGAGFDRQSAQELGLLLRDCTEEDIFGAVSALGGRMVDSNADICAILPFLPCFPVMLKIWLADDEMELSARMMVNAAADHYLTIEDAVTVGSIVMEKLKKEIAAQS